MRKKPSKLNVKKEVIDNFRVESLKHFEGCSPAVKYFSAMFGDQTRNLRTLKKPLVKVILEGKADWIINFCLNMIKPKHRMEFFGIYLHQALKHIEDDEIKRDIEGAFNYYCKNKNDNTVLKLLGVIETHLIPIKSELQYYSDPEILQPSEEVINTLQYEKHVLESIRFFLEDKERKFTRSITDGLMKLAESKCYLNFVEYNYERTLQDIALDLMDYTELWS